MPRHALSLLLLLVLAAPAASQLATEHFFHETDFQAVIAPARIACRAEARVGDGGGPGPELRLGDDSGAPAAKAQLLWSNGERQAFSLDYDAASGRVTFSLGGKELSFIPEREIGEIFIRAEATEPATLILVDGLTLEDEDIWDMASAGGPDGLDYLWIRGALLVDGFRLEGLVTLGWNYDSPKGSELGFQILLGSREGPGLASGSFSGIKSLY